MQTVCDKKKYYWKDSVTPLLYTIDPSVRQDQNAYLFPSLLGGVSNFHTRNIDLESILLGQDSSAQSICRNSENIRPQQSQRALFNTVPNIPMKCDDALSTKVTTYPQEHSNCVQGQSGPECGYKDLWFERNRVIGKCGSVRMSL